MLSLAETLLPLLRGVADQVKGTSFAEDILTHVRNVESIIAKHETAKESELVSYAVSLFSPQAAAAAPAEPAQPAA